MISNKIINMNKCPNKSKKQKTSQIGRASSPPRPKYFHLLAKRITAPNTGGIQVDENVELEGKEKKNQTRRKKLLRRKNNRDK